MGSEPLFTETHQIAIVVPDLDVAMRTYVEEYGIGPWRIYEFGPGTADEMTIDEEPVEYSMHVALAMVGSVEWELIEPLDEQSIYADFLARTGGGLHHVAVGFGDRSYAEVLSTLHAKGHIALQGGGYKGARFSYMSTDRDLGTITEIVDWPPGTVHEPVAVYPADDS